MSLCLVDRRRRGSSHGDMGSVAPFGDSGLLGGIYGGFFGGGHHGQYHNVSSQLGASTSTSQPVFLGGNAPELLNLDGAATEDLVEAPKPKRTGSDRAEKAAMALKSHSEAERRRRERINSHLATLRSMVPCTDKMDKAALLAEVIAHVKKLKTTAARISRHCPVPADADDVAVELVDTGGGGGCSLVKATLSCDDGADLFADVKHALRTLRLKVVGSEVTTLGGRVRFTFLISGDVSLLDSVRQALQAILDKANSALEFAPRASLLNKRRRVSTFESSSSSS